MKNSESTSKDIMMLLANRNISDLIFELAFPYNEKASSDEYIGLLLKPMGNFI